MPTTSIHGTPDYAELDALGLDPSEVVYFSSNINPYGPPASVVEAVQNEISRSFLARYPDSRSQRLREKIGAYHGVPPDAVLVGNGTADLIWLLAHAYGNNRQAAILSPTFSEYADGVIMAGGHPNHPVLPGWQRISRRRFAPAGTTLAQTRKGLQSAAPWLVFICNPNNPTGEYLSPGELRYLWEGAPDALWVIDEAYAEFTEDPWSAAQWVMAGTNGDSRRTRGPGCVVLRSMTKDFALGGLRLGYLLAAPSIVERLQQVQPPWSVNGVAQLAGLVALDEMNWREETTARLRKDVWELQEGLRACGYAPLPTTVSYFLLPVGDAESMRERLVAERMFVRDCTSFGLPDHIRIAARPPDENARLLDAMNRFARQPA
jgi:histidinol-phosphate/aromatic aminotransferase/cobyric acid decarboxylase-like protein